MIDNRWVIEKYEMRDNYILLADTEYRNRYQHIYIENPDAKPSLFDERRRSVDPYYDSFDY